MTTDTERNGAAYHATMYETLDPSAVLDALDAVGLIGDGRLLQLNSYENRVFQAHLTQPDDATGGVVVAKFYRPERWTDAQILEEHAFAHELAAEDVPVMAPRVLAQAQPNRVRLAGSPPTLATVNLGGRTHRFAVSDRCAGRGPELDDPHVLEWLGRFLGRLHQVGARKCFVHRRTLDTSWGRDAQQRILDGEFLGDAERAGWHGASHEALTLAEAAFASLAPSAPLKRLRLHGDFHPGNVMWRDVSAADRGPHVVDLDDACNGPAVQDLWMLLSGDAASMREQLSHVLAGYEMFMPFDRRELALVEPLRTVRMIHHSAWIAQRWSDPAFPAAFPWFGTPSYWSQQTTQLREQIEALREPPALT